MRRAFSIRWTCLAGMALRVETGQCDLLGRDAHVGRETITHSDGLGLSRLWQVAWVDR